MKNRTVFGILMIAFFAISGCKSTQPVVEQQFEPQQVLAEKPADLVMWYQSLRKNLNKNDVLFFYNSKEVELSGTIPKLGESDLKDGAINNMDTTFYVQKTVPAYTAGRIVDLKRDDEGTLIQLSVLFDIKDRTYTLTYVLEDFARYLEREAARKDSRISIQPVRNSGSFILNGQAKLLFQGKESDVLATTKGNDDDRLLVRKTGKSTQIFVKEKAEGQLGNTSGNQPISQPQKNTEIKNNPGSSKSYNPEK
jgi:hypothetical protein